jgi:hypothetical protein
MDQDMALVDPSHTQKQKKIKVKNKIKKKNKIK